MTLFQERTNTNIRSDDRVIVLAPMPGKSTKSSMGLTDNRLFTGENKLHAIFDGGLRLWHLRYEIGGLPEPLKNRWTRFNDMIKDVTSYFKTRNVQVVKVIE